MRIIEDPRDPYGETEPVHQFELPPKVWLLILAAIFCLALWLVSKWTRE